MTAAIIIGLTLLLAAGLALLILGLRGRRINDHPICRGCGFDLVGVLPTGTTCPECGAGIKSSRWVRIGARKKRVTWVLAGLVLTLGAAVPLGTGVVALASGANIVRHKPLGLLLWEARRGSDETRGIIGAELESRMLGGLFDAEQSGLAAELALEIQADIERAWDPVWARVFEQARLAGATTVAQVERFGVQSLVPSLLVRPTVRAGDPLPFEIVTKEYRGIEPAPNNAWFNARVIDVRLGGKPLALGRDTPLGSSQREFSLPTPRANTRRWGPSSSVIAVGTEVDAGRHPFAVTIRVERSTFAAPGQPRPSAPIGRTLTLVGDVDVRASGRADDEPLDLSPEMAQELTALIQKAGIVQQEMQSEGSWVPTINFSWSFQEAHVTSPDSAPTPAIDANVLAVLEDGTERALDELRNETIVQSDTTRAVAQWLHVTSGTHPTPLPGPTVTIRLTLDPERARRFIRAGRPVRGELLVPDVPVYFQTLQGVRVNTVEELRSKNSRPDGQ